MKRSLVISLALIIVSFPTFAGGLLTNTNQHAAFLRNMARGASTEIDAVYSNPAGLAYLSDGFHLSLTIQSAFQTRTINSTFDPFVGNGGLATKKFKGEASVPVIPSMQAAYKKGNWAFSGSFAITGGGGKATFNDGLASFESQVAMVPAMLSANGFPGTNKYDVQSFMEGRQYIFGLQLGATYKLTDYLSVFGGGRMNYVSNSYFGYLRDISANLNGGEMVNINQAFTNMASQLTGAAAAATEAGNTAAAAIYTQKAAAATDVANKTANKELDCDQTGWGLTPILGVDFKKDKWNIGVKYEFNTNLNIENKTKINTTGVAAYEHGVNTPNDIPSLLTVGVEYSVLPTLRASVGWNHFFDTHAKMANNKQDYLSEGTNEYLAGLEWDITNKILISGGYQSTNYGIEDGYQSDMSFSLSSYSIGMGAAFKLSKSLKVNVAYFFTTYDDYTKKSTNYNGTGLPGTDVFARTNKVFGVSADYTF